MNDIRATINSYFHYLLIQSLTYLIILIIKCQKTEKIVQLFSKDIQLNILHHKEKYQILT